jgi:hypothetical protein
MVYRSAGAFALDEGRCRLVPGIERCSGMCK